MPKCPKGFGGCEKNLVSEVDFNKEVGIEAPVGYVVESAIRGLVGSGRAPYLICTNPKCRYGQEPTKRKYWFKIDSSGKVVPKDFLIYYGIGRPKVPKDKK